MDKVYTVMIVDDSPEDRYLLRRFLGKTGLSLVILEVSSGIDGMDLLTTTVDELERQYPGIRAPVTLFLDINMPLMNGWEFVEELERRRDEIQLKPTVVMMYSTSDDDVDKEKVNKYEAVANYIVKGKSSPETLKESILASHQ